MRMTAVGHSGAVKVVWLCTISVSPAALGKWFHMDLASYGHLVLTLSAWAPT